MTAAAAQAGYGRAGEARGSLADALACLAVQKWVEEARRMKKRWIERWKEEQGGR